MPSNDSTNTKRRRTLRRTIAAFFSLVAVGLLFSIEVDELNLASYIQHDQPNQDIELAPKRMPSRDDGRVVFQAKPATDHKIRASKRKVHRASTFLSHISPSRRHPSPACRPHFSAPSGASRNRSDATQFRRLYLYHARKAGGTSLANYLSGVARHHGLEFAQDEWVEAEEPGTHAVPTLYVAHLREPVDRSISHFKYQGRWACRGQLVDMKSGKFVPTEENANKLETWNATGGHSPTTCDERGTGLRLGECAVNCYTQWFSGACPQYNMSTRGQYQVAKAKLLRYNLIIVLEWLRDLEYVAAVEAFFGVPGVTLRRGAVCERPSRRANREIPLVIHNDTETRLIELNEVDIGLYEELTDCADEVAGKKYRFPGFEPSRFANVSVKIPYRKGIKRSKAGKQKHITTM